MAAKYRKISVQIWNDKKFRQLSDDGKLVFIFVLTHPHMSAIGGMRGTTEGLAAELKWSPKRLSEAFREATERDMVRYDEEACLMILPNFIKHNRPESPNVVVSWQKAFEEMPESYLKFELFQCIERQSTAFPDAFVKAFGSLREAFEKSMPNQEQEQEQEQEERICRVPVGNPTARAPVQSQKPEQIPYAEIISHLNERCGCQYKPTSQATRRMVKARWAEGYRLDDFKRVIDHKHGEWSQDGKMCAFLRPETLFSPKFEGYLQAARNGGTVKLCGGPLPPEQDELLQKARAARAERERKKAAQQGGQHAV